MPALLLQTHNESKNVKTKFLLLSALALSTSLLQAMEKLAPAQKQLARTYLATRAQLSVIRYRQGKEARSQQIDYKPDRRLSRLFTQFNAAANELRGMGVNLNTLRFQKGN